MHTGPRLAKALPLGPVPAKSMRVEYGSMECALEIVDDVHDAINHIHKFGSSHTEVVVTENGQCPFFDFSALLFCRTDWISCCLQRTLLIIS